MTEPSRVSLMNLPNLLTVLRLILVPVFLLALFAAGGHDTAARWVAGGIFAVAAITDRYDGHIARKRGQVTDFGKIADPIADKALIGSALVGLSLLHDIAWWITAVIMVREVGITLLRLAVLRYGVIAASPGGKVKTLVQILAIGLFVVPLYAIGAPFAVIDWIRWVMIALAIVLTVLTGIGYLARAGALVTRARRPQQTGMS